MKILQETKLQTLITFDKAKTPEGYLLVGIDEAGRGPLCGPVIAAAVILGDLSRNIPEVLERLDDSKKFSGNEKLREEIYNELTHNNNCIYAVGTGTLEDIEVHNIAQATYLAMFEAYKQVSLKLQSKKHKVLVDGTKTIKHIPETIEQENIVKGDSKSASIAAASIIAKVYRDKIMKEYAIEYPQYKWEKNKGYGTKEHIAAIREFGRCKYHRKTFRIKGLDYEAE